MDGTGTLIKTEWKGKLLCFMSRQLGCMELCPGTLAEPAESLW